MPVAYSLLKTSRKARLMAFNLWAEMSEDYSDEREAFGPDDGEMKQLIEQVRRGGGMNRTAAYGAVPRWFSDPEAWTPYVDDVAVRRATEFHLSAWRSLSLDERALVLENLLAQEEPFGPLGHRPDGGVSEAILRYRDWPEADKRDILSAYHGQKGRVAA